MDNLNSFIDHTLLKVTSVESDYIQLFDEAIKYKFYSACIPPYFVPLAKKSLMGSSVKTCSVVGFPSGLNNLKTKAQETELLIKEGVDEVDMVANLSLIKSNNWNMLLNEISLIKRLCGENPLKVIVESSLLSKEEILNCCLIIKDAGADFIKTSTGFNGPGAQIEDVKYMYSQLEGSQVKIKASGGIRDLNSALNFIDAGCSRIGSSSGVQIINQLKTGSVNETSSSSNY